ncbi:MAG TPA: (d)CMP kinase [candidate division WOR-3 bacterium]|uniref:Cytidylate kinase n=1 Tax=candidate division WOR-3 bacterium TaxID=2052148 RepID=A0A7V5HNA2_UNCW3|nr:(d)CMP kinase [candidate division WOR-3 bacterium]
MPYNNLKIAIDGPAGSGKSTTAKLVAKALGLLPIDTGAMYRAVALKVIREKIDPYDEEKVGEIAGKVNIEQKLENGEIHTYLDGEDVSTAIRTPEVNNTVSIISAYPGVRKKMVELQRKLAKAGGVVLEGRDIGTVVLPDADLKVYMIASLEERARRRLKELREKGMDVSLKDVKQEILMRDEMDSKREYSPLKIPEDAFILDTTNLTVEEQVEKILKEVDRRFGLKGR